MTGPLGWQEGFSEEMMAGRCEGYVGEMCGAGGKITPRRGGCRRWRPER